MTDRPRLVIFYDADCRFCRASVHWLLRQRGPLALRRELVSYDDREARDRFPEIDWTHAEAGVQVKLPSGEIRKDARAAAACLALTTRWKWAGALLDWTPFRPLAQWSYRFIAAHRSSLSKALFRPAHK